LSISFVVLVLQSIEVLQFLDRAEHWKAVHWMQLLSISVTMPLISTARSIAVQVVCVILRKKI
jgi:hypothetical protein